MVKFSINISNSKKYIILKFYLIQLINYIIIVINKCVRCHKTIPKNEFFKCQTCYKVFHGRCLTEQEYAFHSLNNIFQCYECRIKLASLFAMNYNAFPYGQIQNPPMRIMQSPSLFEPSIQIPLIQKKNNNKNNKNLSLIKIHNEKNEEDEYEDESENNLNENFMENMDNKRKTIENIPQLINSFYFINENIKKQNNIANEIYVNYSEEKNKKSNSMMRNLKSKIKEKSKSKKNNYVFNINLLQILENYDLTNEEKLIYILDNYKNVKIDPLILKVLENRKKRRKNEDFENKNLNISNGNQNGIIKDGTKIKVALNENNIQNSNENNTYIPPPVKINFPIDDKTLFQNLEKYKVNPDILDRPGFIKINLEFDILNKLFIIWDFLITFKDTVFTEKVCDFEIDKNISTFYSNLLDNKDNYSFYKSILISLILLCVKNIPYAIPSPKSPRLFLLKSILDNLHSISYNIIYDSPLVILREIVSCYIYNNSISEDNLTTLKNIFVEVNNAKNKENFENNMKIYEKDPEKEDNIAKIDKKTKIYLLHIIIGLCFETILIKDKIKLEYENMNSLSYNKKDLDESLFDTEKRMKELSKMENFKTLPNEIENLQKKLNELKGIKTDENNEKNKTENNDELLKEEEKNSEIKNIENQNKKKEIQELETQIERYKSILKENEKLIERKKEINTKISEIFEKIYNLKTLRKKYLGIDYQSNEYYYFISVPNIIYIKNKKNKEWGFYENKDDIQKLINKLTDKGKNEKKLKAILKLIFSQMKEKEQKEKEKELEKELNKEKNMEKINEEKKQENNNNINENKMEEEKEDKKEIIKDEKAKNEEEILKNKVYSINLGIPKKKGRKPKEEGNIDNIRILEDEVEEIKEENNEENKTNNEIGNKDNKDKDNKAPIVQPKKELFTFIISEERLQLNIILMKIDDVFSEYLIQYNKQWESEKNRSMWKSIITHNATDKNILTSLKMFNHKFKNPYKILSAEEEQELILKEKINKGNNFVFDEKNGNKFSIPETNNLLLLSPKVKIWSKEMDLIDIDNYYNNDLLVNVYSREQLCYVVHFYEMAIFGLVHRREGKRKL